MSFSDITLTCKDCGNPFVFTAGEQEFYQQRGLMNQPAQDLGRRRELRRRFTWRRWRRLRRRA